MIPAASNTAFDRLWKQGKLQQARESLAAWQESRALPNLTAEEIAFLDRAIEGGKQLVVDRQRALREWWT